MWRSFTCVALAAALLFLLHSGVPAVAETRVALVIGNGAYASLKPVLPNPPADARAMAELLSGLGFNVETVIDGTKDQMESAIANLVRKSRNADMALVFYAGHGIQDQGKNYLVPVDAELEDETDLRRRFVRLDDLLEDLSSASATDARILLLDACRDNDAIESLRAAVPKSRSLGVSRGLAAIPKSVGQLVAFATLAGHVAADGGGTNSPFTTALLAHLGEKGVELRTVLTEVRADVAKANDQVPEVSDSLNSLIFLNPAAKGVPQIEDAALPAKRAEDALAWDGLKDTTSVAMLTSFKERYPASIYAQFADVRIKELEAKEKHDPPPPPDPVIAAFDGADHGDSVDGWMQFLRLYPSNEPFTSAAKYRLAQLVHVAKPEQDASLATTEPPPPPPPPPPSGRYYYVTGLDPNGFNWLALRNAPSSSAPWSATQMGPGTLLTLLGQEGEWYHVQMKDTGETGWASSRFIACCHDADANETITREEPKTPDSSDYYYVTGLDPNGINWLALRSAPSFKASWSATQMATGTLLSVLGQRGEWYHVRLQSGETGWANKKFVKCCRKSSG